MNYRDHTGDSLMIIVSLPSGFEMDDMCAINIGTCGDYIQLTLKEPEILTYWQFLSINQESKLGGVSFGRIHPRTVSHKRAVLIDRKIDSPKTQNQIFCTCTINLPFSVRQEFFSEEAKNGIEFLQNGDTGEIVLVLSVVKMDYDLISAGIGNLQIKSVKSPTP